VEVRITPITILPPTSHTNGRLLHWHKSRRWMTISVKGGGYRTGSRTPVTFTVLDAIPVSNPYKNNNTNNAQLDFMDPYAAPAVANATIAEPRARTLVGLVSRGGRGAPPPAGRQKRLWRRAKGATSLRRGTPS
jgi:hypothetical protein